jgi:hypothetical protein
MLILVQHAAEAVTSADGQVCEPVQFGDRFGQWCERSGVRDALVRTVLVIEDLELARRVPQMALVPDQRAVEQLAAAGPHPFGNSSLLLGSVWCRTTACWNPVQVIVSLVYQVARKLLAVPALLLRRDVTKECTASGGWACCAGW